MYSLIGCKVTFSHMWCYLRSEWHTCISSRKAVGTCVLQLGLGSEHRLLSLTLKMLDLSLVGNCRVS